MNERILSRLEGRWQKEDRLRMEGAVRKISGDPDLRFFLARVLTECGYGSAPATSDPLTMARECGKLAVAEALIAELDHIEPSLLPTLILETTNERHSRNAEFNARSRQSNDEY